MQQQKQQRQQKQQEKVIQSAVQEQGDVNDLVAAPVERTQPQVRRFAQRRFCRLGNEVCDELLRAGRSFGVIRYAIITARNRFQFVPAPEIPHEALLGAPRAVIEAEQRNQVLRCD